MYQDDFNDELENNVLVSVSVPNEENLTNASKELVSKIIEEKDADKLKELESLFDMNIRKKNIARMDRLSDLLAMVDDEVITRFATDPNSFDNDQLLSYMTSTQNQILNVRNSMDKTPLIQVNNQTNEIHIEDGTGFDRESRKKILDAVMSIIENTKSDDVIEVEGEIIEDA